MVNAATAVLATTPAVLLVLGLPQCGTDAVSDVLRRCGAQAETASTLAHAQHELLSSLGNGWNSPLELPDRCFASKQATEFQSALADAFVQASPDQYSMACLHGMERVLPLWQHALESNNHAYCHLLVVRHPLDVAEQFRSSHGWNRDHALLIWLQSNLAMERHSRGKKRVIVDSEQVRWDLDAALNRIESALQLSLPERNHKTLLEIEATQENSSKDQPPAATSANHGSLILTMALQLHAWLLAEAQGEKQLIHLPQTIRQQLQLAESVMGRTLSDLSVKNETLHHQLSQLEQRRSVRLSNWLRGVRSPEA